MSQTQQECGIQEIYYQHYLFQITIINEKEVGLRVFDTQALQIFFIDRHVFTNNINSSTLLAILNKKNEQSLEMLIEDIKNSEDQQYLKLTLKVQYNFLPLMQEIITLSKTNEVDNSVMIQIQQKLINLKINQLNEMFDDQCNLGEKYVVTVNQGSYYEYSHQVTQLEIPKEGKYEINLSLYTLSTGGYIYLCITSQSSPMENLLGIPEQIIYDQNNEQQMRPLIIRTIKNLQAGTLLTLNTTNSDCYPWTMKNLILSATAV